jgi:hypothetical protein
MSAIALSDVAVDHVGHLAMSGLDLLPPLVTWLWLIALTAVLAVHCGHVAHRGAQHRWFHASHILMLISMLYMYASMEFGWAWFPRIWWVTIFSMSSAAVAAWMVLHFVQRRPVSILWVLALVMQAAMVYMWLPDWAPALTWTLVLYYGLEAAAWLAGFLDDSIPTMAVGRGDGGLAVPLVHDSTLNRVSMATMAASMAYMFAAMQLMQLMQSMT